MTIRLFSFRFWHVPYNNSIYSNFSSLFRAKFKTAVMICKRYYAVTHLMVVIIQSIASHNIRGTLSTRTQLDPGGYFAPLIPSIKIVLSKFLEIPVHFIYEQKIKSARVDDHEMVQIVSIFLFLFKENDVFVLI